MTIRHIPFSSNPGLETPDPVLDPFRSFIDCFTPSLKMSATLPFRDINVHASSSYYAFSSPSSPNAPTLVVDRPSGDLRLSDAKVTGGHRVSNIPGILGIIHLKLGMVCD